MVPKQIYTIIDDDLPRPRNYPYIQESAEYKALYQKLVKYFYNDTKQIVSDVGANI